jgi:hypothetical protein
MESARRQGYGPALLDTIQRRHGDSDMSATYLTSAVRTPV